MTQNFIRRPLNKAAYFVYLSALLILLGSCEKTEDSLGLQLQDEEDLINLIIVDDLDITTYTVLADSTRTNELSRAMIGDLQHPEFGSHQSTLFTQVRLSALGVDFADGSAAQNVTLDSLVLALEYFEENSIYGAEEPMVFSVQRLDERLDSDSLYYSNQETSVLSDELLYSTDAITPLQNEETVVGEDTLPAQLRLRLVDALGEELLLSGLEDNSPFDDVDDFLDYFKGIKISAAKQGANGGIVFFNLLSSNSKLTLYYKNETDTLSFDFMINENSQRYLKFDHDYSGTSINNQISDSTLGTQELYLQAMAGLNLRVDVSSTLAISDTSEIALNKAEIVLPVVQESLNEDFPFPPRLFATYVNNVGTVASVPDIFEGDIHSDGYYDENAGEYRINITRYIQQLRTGLINDPELKILPTSNSISANFVKLVGSEGMDKRAKLVLIYTQFE
jgi:hypothetical protein